MFSWRRREYEGGLGFLFSKSSQRPQESQEVQFYESSHDQNYARYRAILKSLTGILKYWYFIIFFMKW